jgi:hypothetical protein
MWFSTQILKFEVKHLSNSAIYFLLNMIIVTHYVQHNVYGLGAVHHRADCHGSAEPQ